MPNIVTTCRYFNCMSCTFTLLLEREGVGENWPCFAIIPCPRKPVPVDMDEFRRTEELGYVFLHNPGSFEEYAARTHDLDGPWYALSDDAERMEGTMSDETHLPWKESLEIAQAELINLRSENARLRAEVEELRKDKERLDWMDQQKEEEYLLVQLMEDDMGTCFSVTAVGGGAYKKTIRAAIDAAMKE